MTQRIFDIENEKDYTDLWDIVPEDIKTIKRSSQNTVEYITNLGFKSNRQYIKINWHDKTEITRPIQECTEADIGKLCKFWDDDEKSYLGILVDITHTKGCTAYIIDSPTNKNIFCLHCRRLTKTEIEELC
jgi:hypothetical protein